MKTKKLEWQELHGVLTPGGDPCYVCPVCGKGQHVYGIESPESYTHTCANCGNTVVYPWEAKKE